jgi:hypothetical protein
VVRRVADYRQQEIARVDANYVLKWLQQFEEGDQPIILSETERLLHKTYISRTAAKSWMGKLALNSDLAGNMPKDFWSTSGYLRLQTGSKSQTDMLTLLDEVLSEQFKLSTDSQTSTSNTYLYIDDISFSGNQVKNDLLGWAKKNDIRNAAVHIIVIGVYTNGEYYAKRELKKEFDERKISVRFWASARLQSGIGRIADAGVLWPTKLPDEQYVNQWKATLAPHTDYFKPRPPNGRGSTNLFSSEANREIVEQAFLKKGAYIFSLPKILKLPCDPLGSARFELPDSVQL